MMTTPRSSILVLTWNSGMSALAAVESALTQSGEIGGVEVLLLDNASSDGVPERIVERFGDELRFVRFESNLGYTGGYNRGIALARGEVVVLLNPDAVLDSEFLARALPEFCDPRLGLVAPKLMRPDGTTVDSSGQFLARSRRTIDRGYGRPLDPARDRKSPVLSACGAAAVYRREMLEDVADAEGQYLDADFFAFNEDLELGWRAWRAGWTARFVPEAVCIHERSGGRSPGRLGLAFARPPDVIAHIVKNRWLAMLRHDRIASIAQDLPWIAGREIAWMVALAVLRPAVIGALWRQRRTIARALEKRSRDGRREGRWGRWRLDVPPRGIWRSAGDGGGARAVEKPT